MEPGVRALPFRSAHAVLRYGEPADGVVSERVELWARVSDAGQIERSTTVTGGSLRRPQLVTAVPVPRWGELR